MWVIKLSKAYFESRFFLEEFCPCEAPYPVTRAPPVMTVT